MGTQPHTTIKRNLLFASIFGVMQTGLRQDRILLEITSHKQNDDITGIK